MNYRRCVCLTPFAYRVFNDNHTVGFFFFLTMVTRFFPSFELYSSRTFELTFFFFLENNFGTFQKRSK